MEEKAIGMPISSTWSRFSSSPCSLIRLTSRVKYFLRSLAVRRGQGPSSKARRAAATARSTSAVLAMAKLVTTSLVAGLS